MAAICALALLASSSLLPMPQNPTRAVCGLRSGEIMMKGKPSRGMPKKATTQPGDMVNTGVKKRMMVRDFQDKNEWVKVGKLAELVPAIGATKAVEAGRAPGAMGPTGFSEGSTYIWCLVHGELSGAEAAGDAKDKVFAVDGACRTCQFPLTQAQYAAGGGGNEQTITCGLCGTKYSLESGKTVDFLPGDNPIRFAAKLANEKNGPQRLGSLPTRVSKSGNIFIRLPDNTIMT
mmetsp:Transcript_33224/g.107445  ORF Transcript_33224/g.107445 Transcript_33224/m.107445 type:complete len:233 (+) Transcript_33224:66-764(+)